MNIEDKNTDSSASDDYSVIAQRLINGEQAAANDLVDRFYKKIYLYMRRLGHGSQISEDLTQECFLNAWRYAGQLRNTKALSSWIYRIASNVSRLYWRRKKAVNLIDVTEVEIEDVNNESIEKAEKEEMYEILEQTIGELPIKLRQAIVLHYMQNLTISETAEVIGIREGTLKSRLNRALEMMRTKLRKNKQDIKE